MRGGTFYEAEVEKTGLSYADDRMWDKGRARR